MALDGQTDGGGVGLMGGRGFTIAIVALLAVGGVLIYLSRSNPPPGPEAPEGVEVFEDLATDHTEGPVDYEQEPPVGGPHSGTPLTCGFYDEPVPAENAVHSLEHGAIWITFAPGLEEQDVDRLRGFAGPKVLVSPWPGDLPAPVVASAWERQILLDGADDERLPAFIETFRDGDQAPEPFAACAGLGQPR